MDSLWPKPQYQLRDLRDFIAVLEQRGDLRRIAAPVSPVLELTEISRRVLEKGGPALLFEQVGGQSKPVLCNLFGTRERIGLALGRDDPEVMHTLGRLLALLRQPEPPKGIADAWS
jgi:4-hydroxy-3-polyprenylbenzoate decarboxylase